MSRKKANHLASRTEQIATAKFSLPSNLLARHQLLTELSTLVRHQLEGLLTAEQLTSCQVVDFDANSATLCVDNHTLANYLRYLSDQVVSRLVGSCDSFTHLRSVQVIVVTLPPPLSQKSC